MLALSSRRLGAGAAHLARAAEAARASGFSWVHAAVPPVDAAAARAALDRAAVVLEGVSTEPVASLDALGPALDRAAETARWLRDRRVVVDFGPLPGAEAGREVAVDALARALYAAFSRWQGIAIAVRGGAGGDALLGLVETEWLLDALAGKAIGVWLDPVRAEALEEAKRPGSPLDWADRLARRTSGIALHGPGPRGEGHGLPEEGGLDWSTLRGLLPALAPRVLDVGPDAAEVALVETRRRFEEALGW